MTWVYSATGMLTKSDIDNHPSLSHFDLSGDHADYRGNRDMCMCPTLMCRSHIHTNGTSIM